MSEEQQQQTPPPANAKEASARLEVLKANDEFTGKLLGGDPYAAKEFHDLHVMAAEGSGMSDVDKAMTGALPDVPDSGLRMMAGTADMLRDIGLRDEVVRQVLEDQPVTEAEFNAAKAWQTRAMKDQAFVKLYLEGDIEARQKMTLASIIISSPIKTEKAA